MTVLNMMVVIIMVVNAQDRDKINCRRALLSLHIDPIVKGQPVRNIKGFVVVLNE